MCPITIKTLVNLVLFGNANAEEFPKRFSENSRRFLVLKEKKHFYSNQNWVMMVFHNHFKCCKAFCYKV